MAKEAAKKRAARKRVAKKKAAKKPTLRTRAKKAGKKAGKKVKKAAGSDVGRAGIGAAGGALLLGPIGAAAGAYAGLKTRKQPEGNPGLMLVRPKGKKRGPPQKTMARDIFRMDSALRNMNEPLARRIYRQHKAAYEFLERRDINQQVSPRSKMYSAVVALHSDLARQVPHAARMNPEPMVKLTPTMGTLLLDYHKGSSEIEHVAASALRGEKIPLTFVVKARNKLARMHKMQPRAAEKEQIGDLVEALDKVIAKGRKSMGRKSNPTKRTRKKTGAALRKKGRFHKGYVPTAEEAKQFERRYGAGSQLDKLTTKYRKARQRWLAVAQRSHSTPGEISRAKKRADDAEAKLVLYASTLGITPEDFETYMAHAIAMEGIAKTRRGNPGKLVPRAELAGNPLKKVTERTPDKKFREAVSRNIAIEMHAGKPQKQAVAIALSTARKQAPVKTRKLYGRAPVSNPQPNPCLGMHFHAKDADELLEAAEKSARRQVKGRKKNPRGGIEAGLGVPLRLHGKGKKGITEWKRWHKRSIDSLIKRRPSEARSLSTIHSGRVVVVDAIMKAVKEAGPGGIGHEPLIKKAWAQVKSELDPRTIYQSGIESGTVRHYIHVLGYFGAIEYSGGKWRVAGVKPNPKKGNPKNPKKNARSNLRRGTVIDEWVVEHWAWGPPSHKNGPTAVLHDPSRHWTLLVSGGTAHLRPRADMAKLGRISPEEWQRGWRKKEVEGRLDRKVKQAIAWANTKIRSGNPSRSPYEMSVASALGVLNLSPGASPSEVRAAYRRKVSRHHPDISRGGPSTLFMMAHEARETLLRHGTNAPKRRNPKKKAKKKAKKKPTTMARHRKKSAAEEEAIAEAAYQAWKAKHYEEFMAGQESSRKAMAEARKATKVKVAKGNPGKTHRQAMAILRRRHPNNPDLEDIVTSVSPRMSRAAAKIQVEYQRLRGWTDPEFVAAASKGGRGHDPSEDVRELPERIGNPRKRKSSKKTKRKTKKKATRRKTPQYQLLINRCQKLWAHYCERPSKKRLEAIYRHLDKMKESASKKVATERSKCLRAANKEAKRLKYKRKK